MTKLLDKAIERARGLPEDEQDAMAIAMLTIADDRVVDQPMDDETRSAIREGLDQARRGEFATEDEVRALRLRYGV
jgi:predicted transcriptional regulator